MNRFLVLRARMNTDVMFSKNSDEWQTPPSLYERLNNVFHFKLDPCTTEDNPLKTERYYTKEQDGLSRYWGNASTFINPPYSQIKKWTNRAHKELQDRIDEQGDARLVKPIVMLVPSRTDTQWFHDLSDHKWAQVIFLKGRLKFGGAASSSAPFPSCLIVLQELLSFIHPYQKLGCDLISCYKLNLKKERM